MKSGEYQAHRTPHVLHAPVTHPAANSNEQRRARNVYGLKEERFNGVVYFRCPHCPAAFLNAGEASRHCDAPPTYS